MITKTNIKKNFFFLFFLSILKLTFGGIIQPDDIIPLEISPTYSESIGIKGTKFIFRFFIPNNLDKDQMPTVRGYGASNGQYIGIRFNMKINPFNEDIRHSCLISQIENNLNIPLIPMESEVDKTIYCKINSYDNTHILFPGYNYKLTITIVEDLLNALNDLISISIFTSTSEKEDGEIIDIGTFNHINIIPQHNFNTPQNPVVNLEPINTDLNIEVESDFNFDIKISFNYWFSWDDYIIILNLPKNQVNTENPMMKISKPTSDSNVNVPTGTIHSINLESNEERKYIGFYLDGSLTENNNGDILLLNFYGLKTKESGLINEDNDNNNFIGVEVRYRNSYVICGSKKINFYISLGNVKFEVKHPETDSEKGYKFDVFRGGAFQIEFLINTQKNVYNKYILIKQKDSKQNKRVTFIASSCDFSNFNISSSNFNEIPKCHPIKIKNYLDSEDNYNGIFFYYPYIIKSNTDYRLRVWMFFDECGPEESSSSTYVEENAKVEINFYLEMYNNIDKNEIAEKRINSKYIFMNKIATESGIICYSTYMGDKNYQNGYLFNIDSYSVENKLLYREYFNWNIYNPNEGDENSIINDIFNVNKGSVKPKFIYSRNGNNLEDGTNLLLVNKIILDSGNNEKLGGFFPMGLFKNNIGGKIVAIKGKFFMKLSKNFFAQKRDTNGNEEKCYISWAFGSKSITDNLSLIPKPKFYPLQKYNFITNSEKFFDDPTVLFNPLIENINDYSMESKSNEGWDDSLNKAEWSFGDDENLEDQISDESPVDIYFGLSDTCHYWTKLNQTITSLYTPIEIIIGITGENTDYSRVMRFIKLFPEGGVWQDNYLDNENKFIKSNDFIIKNHYAFNNYKLDGDININEKGVCLLEILPGILDSQEALSSNFFLWIFLGSLLDTDYDQISSTYPVGNLRDSSKAYGYSSQHSLHKKNFYAKPSQNQKSDISSPIYNLATSMNSIYQSASSGYLFYLGSLIVFYNKVKRNSLYDLSNDPLLIPYYCPYYISEGTTDPYSLGIFPSFIASFGSFESMTNFGNKGFEKLVAKKINEKQLNTLMLSGIKIVHDNNNYLEHFYNTVKFINNYSDNLMTLDVWNSDTEYITCNNEYDSIDSFIFFFNEKITQLKDIYPQAYIPNQLKSLSKSKKGNYCFYVYGKKFCTGLYGVTNSDLFLTRNTPISTDNTPYLSINLKFEISQDLLKCQNSDKFCTNDLIGFWGISSNHDNIQYVTNYYIDSFLIDFNIYRTYINNNPPTFSLGQTMAFKDDPAIFIKIIFNSPFKTAILSNTILSFNIKSITNSQCSVQSSDVNLPSSTCETDSSTGNIKCQLIDSSMTYTIFCYKIKYENSGKFTFYNFKLNLQGEENNSGLESLIFEDKNEYPLIITNSNLNPYTPIVQGSYITIPYNLYSYSKLELKIDLRRPSHPGMKITIIFDNYNSFDENTECKFALRRLNSFSMNDINMEDYWTQGNGIIYNCKVSKNVDDGVTKYIITAILDNKIYIAEKELSHYAYIYIWPLRTYILDYIYLSVTVNDNYILNSIEPEDKKIYFSSVNQVIDSKECDTSISNFFSISFSSNILGDLSDYTFTFYFNSLTITNSISLAQIFFPKEINFECEECVKCYDVTGTTSTIINCNFEDYNILNIFFKNAINSSNRNSILVLVTGIINPKEDISSKKIFLNLININSLGNRKAVFSGHYSFTDIFISEPKIGRLRFFYVQKAISNQNPRQKANYIFRIGFDYANEDYSSSSLPRLASNSLLYIYFPRDYYLYINDNPTGTTVRYYYINGLINPFSAESKILGRKLQILINTATDPTIKLKYIEISINNIKNPNKIISTTENIIKNKYTGYFKVVCLNNPNDPSISTSQYYYTTGINSNTYRSDYINDESIRTNEFNWFRGNLIETDYSNKNKLIIDILYNKKNYNFIFLQPGRYTKVHFVTSSDNENITNFYLYPNSTTIYFSSDSIVKTLEDSYIIPSLYGEPYEFYIGVPCSTNDGIYIVSPKISNNEYYIESPSIIINVRQIEKAKIEYIEDEIGISPIDAKTRIYYYLSEINVDDLTISWTQNSINNNKNVDMDIITIPGKTYTDSDRKISNIFSTLNIKLKTGSTESGSNNFHFKSSNNINRCYELYPEDLLIREMSVISHLNFDASPNYKLSDDLIIKNSGNDDNLLSNEIKFDFSPPILQPSFILCELYCQYKAGDDDSKLLFLNYDSMKNYLNIVNQNYFRKYSTYYFSTSLTEASLIFSNIIKGYQYNAKCVYQSTHSDSSSIKYKSYILTSQNLHSTYPPKTRCNTFYFVSPIKEEIQQKYINYCQYIIGKNLGYNTGGCIICSDSSGKIISPGYNLYFPFSCQNEKCYNKTNNYYIDDMYDLAEEFNTNSNSNIYEFTICATSNRICPSQISEDTFNSAFNEFVNNVKSTENVNKLFNIDYSDNENYIIYNGFYQNKIFVEGNLNEDDISIEFLSEFDKDGKAIWKASYNSEVNFNILCFWRIKISTYQTPTMEEMTNCLEDDSFCGIFVANYGGHSYEIPDKKKSDVVVGEYTLYITCSYFVPSPIYFTSIKNIKTIEIKEESFSRKLIYLKFLNIFLFLIIFI